MTEWFVRFREKGPGKKRFGSPSFTWTWAETSDAAIKRSGMSGRTQKFGLSRSCYRIRRPLMS